MSDELADRPHEVLRADEGREAELENGEIILCADGSGRVTGIPAAVWSFAVSGYRVLPRWLAARAGLPVDKALDDQVHDLVARIAELLDLFAQADDVLAETLAHTLTRAQLGLEPVTQTEEEAE